MKPILDNFDYMILGLQYTLGLAAIGILGAFLLGSLVAVARQSKVRLVSLLAQSFIGLVRGIPLLLFIFFTYFVITIAGINVSAFVSGAISLVIFSSAYVAEIIRGGLKSVDKGQMEAARSSGLSHAGAMRYVVLPQAIRRMMPALAGEFIMLLKETSLVSVIGVQEFYTRVSTTNARLMVHSLELLSFAAIVYFFMCFSLSVIARRLELRSDV